MAWSEMIDDIVAHRFFVYTELLRNQETPCFWLNEDNLGDKNSQSEPSRPDGGALTHPGEYSKIHAGDC